MKRSLAKLKAEARKQWKKYHAIADEYSCGIHLAEHISPRITDAKRDFNAAMDALARIDPSTPKARL